MSIGTVLSRITGVIRLAVIAAALGIAESRLTDTYNIANTVPNIIYEVVLGGMVTSAMFVPLFVELLEKESRERAWEVISAILNVSLLGLTAITLVGVLAAPLIAHFYAGRLEGAEAVLQQRVITFLLRLFIPQVVLYGLYFIVAGILNAHKRFAPPMYTPIANNFVVIAAFLAFHALFGRVTLATVTTSQLLLIGLATTASVAPMGLLLLPYLRGLGRYRLTLSLEHPSIKKLARLSVFMIGFVAANQVGYIVIQWLANAQQGGFSAYISASTFFLLPVGLFVWSLTSALLPAMSEHALHERWDAFVERLSVGVRSTCFLLLPSAVGYFVLAQPIVRLLLEHGVATSRSTRLVAAVLQFFVLGLVQFGVFQLFVRAFYAMQDAKTPFLINCAVVAVNVAVNVPMFLALGARGLGVGQAIAYTIGVVLQATFLRRRVGDLDLRKTTRSVARMAAAATGMGAIVWSVSRWMERSFSDGLIADAFMVALAVSLGALSYLALAHLLKVEELSYVRGLLKRRR